MREKKGNTQQLWFLVLKEVKMGWSLRVGQDTQPEKGGETLDPLYQIFVLLTSDHGRSQGILN